MEPNGEYPGMFPLIPKDIPKIDEKILSYLSPADCAKIKLVSKRWYKLAHRDMRVYAEIITPPVEEGDLVGVRIHGETEIGLVARDKLVCVPDCDTLRVCRMAAKGEKGFYGGFYQVWTNHLYRAGRPIGRD